MKLYKISFKLGQVVGLMKDKNQGRNKNDGHKGDKMRQVAIFNAKSQS